MDWLMICWKGLLGGVAALGFGLLFNIPNRTMIHVFLLGLLGIVLKNILIESGVSIVLACFVGATSIGIVTLWAAKSKHAPPLVFSIPAVIPMVPGIFTYKFMLGLIQLTTAKSDVFGDIATETMSNGLKATFIIMCLAVGVSMPNLIFRRQTFHFMGKKREAQKGN